MNGDDERKRASLQRVGRLLEGARHVAADPALVPLLVESTGLSAEGVRLGLASYLELSPSVAELERLVDGATPAPRVHVILSANVLTAPLRALAVALAQSANVSVKPSRRDPVLTRALVTACPELAITLEESRGVGSFEEGEIHVYGRDETIADVRAQARGSVRVRAHGAGFGVAIVTRDAELVTAARSVAEDVVVFDQRGCLSPRIVAVEGDLPRGELFATALHESLDQLGKAVPRGELDADERMGARRYVENMTFVGRVKQGEGHVVGLGPSGCPPFVGPPGRHVHVAVVRDVEEARELLFVLHRSMVAMGTDDVEGVRSRWPAARHLRWSRLGQMQKPPLDGPVDLRSNDPTGRGQRGALYSH